MTEEQKIRFSEALLRFAGDCELLSAMAAMVSEDAPEVLENLRNQVAADQLPQVAATAHKLKGMLSTFDTAGPVLDLEELILSARAGQSQQVAIYFHSVDGQVQYLLREILLLN